MKLKVVAKPNGNVTFDVNNDSQFDGFDITITPSRLYASYGFYSDEVAAKKQLCAKIYNYCVEKHETDYYFFKNYMKNITYFSYNSKGDVIRVANDVDWCLGQDIKRVNMKEYKADPSKYIGSIADFSSIVRMAVTNRKNTPDIYSIMQLLGRDTTIARMEDTISKL